MLIAEFKPIFRANNSSRSDIRRTSIVRTIKKLPYFVHTLINTISEQKAIDPAVYEKTFKKTLYWIDELQNLFHIKGKLVSSFSYEQSLGLFFCEEKILAVCESRSKAEKILEYWKLNTLKGLKELCNISPVFFIYLELINKLLAPLNKHDLEDELKWLRKQVSSMK